MCQQCTTFSLVVVTITVSSSILETRGLAVKRLQHKFFPLITDYQWPSYYRARRGFQCKAPIMDVLLERGMEAAVQREQSDGISCNLRKAQGVTARVGEASVCLRTPWGMCRAFTALRPNTTAFSYIRTPLVLLVILVLVIQ